MSLIPWLHAVHVCANLLWIGAIVGVAVILPGAQGTTELRGAIALKLYRTVANPGFIVSFLAGTTLLLMNPKYYFVHTHMMHAKLPLALGVIALHHIIGRRTRQMASGTAAPPGILPAYLLLACGLGAAALALLKPF